MHFHTFQGRDGHWYWHAKSVNGVILADGAEGYTTRSSARRAVLRFIERMYIGGHALDGEAAS